MSKDNLIIEEWWTLGWPGDTIPDDTIQTRKKPFGESSSSENESHDPCSINCHDEGQKSNHQHYETDKGKNGRHQCCHSPKQN